MKRTFRFLPVLAVALLTAAVALAASPKAPKATMSAKMALPAHTETATFAGGCFWSMETDFENFPGVLSVTSGYTGGTKKNPTYEDVGSKTTGHYESVDVLYDPAKVTYAQLLERFWHGIDPTQADGQLYDVGPEYRTAIFYHDAAQQKLALDSKARIEKSGMLRAPVATQILPATVFYAAEDYHQDFAQKNRAYYHQYRQGSGRDQRTLELWGKTQTLPIER